MQELIDISLSGLNIIPTVLMVFIMIYWIIVIIGVVDIDTLDFDLDVDADIDVDGDVEVGGDGLTSVLAFFNIGHMPLMIFLSFLIFPMWILTIISAQYLGIDNVFISAGVLILIFIVSLFIAKILTTPIAKFYMKLRQEDEAVNPLGKRCKVLLTVKSDSIGQAEINADGTSIRINAVARDGVEIKKGEYALVIDYIKNENHYLIEPDQ